VDQLVAGCQVWNILDVAEVTDHLLVNFSLFVVLEVLWIAQADLEEALDAYNRAIQLDPTNADAWLNMGAIFRKVKRLEEAFAATDRAISLNPSSSDAYLNMAVILRELKHTEKSIEASERSIKFNPENIDAWFNKGVALYELKKYEESIRALGQARKLQAKNEYLRGTLISAKTLIADWSGIDKEIDNLCIEIKQQKHVVAPFLLLALLPTGKSYPSSFGEKE